MSTNVQTQPPAPSIEPPPRLFQFSLLSMFIVTLAVAITCSLVFSMPAVVGIPLLMFVSVALAAVLITVVVYGSGFQRTFCIGALVPFGVLLFTLAFAGVILFLDGPRPSWDDRLQFASRLMMVGFWLSSVLVGGICVGVRRLIEERAA